MELLCIIPYEDLKVGIKYKIIDEDANEYLVEKDFNYIRVEKKYFEPIVTMEILSDRLRTGRYEYFNKYSTIYDEYVRYEIVFKHYDVFVKYEYSIFYIELIGIVNKVEVKTYEWRVV